MKDKTGLWEKESKKGKKYYTGKLRIEAEEYSIALFKNENKKDKQPDFTLYYEKKEKENTKKSYTTDEVVYADFGNSADDISDEDLAF